MQNYEWLFKKIGKGYPSISLEFGEIWKVNNQAWKNIEELKILETREGWHPGLCIKPGARQMAFGTSKLKHRIYGLKQMIVENIEIGNSIKSTRFILDYSLPVTFADLHLNEKPRKLSETDLEKLDKLLKA